MTIYEFVTPSDPITFKAENDKIAFFCSVILGNGKAGCNNSETGEAVGSLLLFDPDSEETMKTKLGCDISDFSDKNEAEIIECFKSFAYGSISDRETYDSAIEAITDEERLLEFKKTHEDKNRSSMSKWVQTAWQYADKIGKNHE